MPMEVVAGSVMQRVLDRFDQLVRPGATCLLAVSGGPDSIAMLDLLHRTAPLHQRHLLVGHIDHGIAAESGMIADQVRAATVSRALTFHVRELSLGAGTSETRARAARRAALRSIASETGATAIVLAHHVDDQAETVLLRLLRGSGPAGLAAMAGRTGIWVRPLLELRRVELAAYLARRGLTAWTDPANSDPRHLRSWLRAEVLPRLQARLPDVVDRLGRTARQAAAGRAAWAQVPQELTELGLERSGRGISVAAPVLLGYRSALRHAVLAALGRQVGVLLGARRLSALDRLLLIESGAGRATLSSDVQAELSFGRLTLYHIANAPIEPVRLMPESVARVDDAELRVTVGPTRGSAREGWQAELVPQGYLARRCRAGDRIRPLGGTGSRAVSVLLREAGVSPARRRVWPVVVTGDDATIVWVPGICRSDAAVPLEGTEAWRVECAFS